MLGLIALASLIGGGVLVGVHATQRDADGFYASGSTSLSTPTSAFVSETLDVGTGHPGWLFDKGRLGTVRVTATGTASCPVFVGVARQAEVDAYLRGVAYDEITDFDVHPLTTTTARHAGARRAGCSGRSQLLGRQSASGAGRQTVTWPVQKGDWAVVVMNADGTPGVAHRPEARRRGSVSCSGSESGCSLGGGALAVGAGALDPRRPPPVTEARCRGDRSAARPRGRGVMIASIAVRGSGPAVLDRVEADARRETGLARIAIAVVALHVVDDSFLQPNPGTSAADHLVGGLVPLALLVAARALYGRAPRRARARRSRCSPASSACSPASRRAYYANAVGPSGDDYTGLLSILAGLAAARPRRVARSGGRGGRDDAHWWRYLRRLLRIARRASVVAWVVLLPVAVAYVVTHAARAQVPGGRPRRSARGRRVRDERRPAAPGAGTSRRATAPP